MANDGITWITKGGQHIPIIDGKVGGKSTNDYMNEKIRNKGKGLSKEQQDFFKNSKVRDKNGNLEVVYHGTNNEFEFFDIAKVGENFFQSERGFYFTNSKYTAKTYGKKIKEVYLNFENPYILNSPSKLHPIQYFDAHSAEIIPHAFYQNDFDGIIIKGAGEYIGKNLYFAIKPNQIKSITNRKPTKSVNINK